MSRIAHGLDDAPPPDDAATAGEGVPVWVEIPDGYAALPLDDPEDVVSRAEALLVELAPDALRPAVVPVLGSLAVFLRDLADRNAVYCGLGRHLSALNGGEVTSTLVVAVQETGGTGDPRLLLREMLERRADDDWHGQADLLELADRPVLFFESVPDLPAPRLPGGPDLPEGTTAPVFLLEALVPSDTGTHLGVIEFATSFADDGPEFRAMVALTAASLSFDPPSADASESPSAAAPATSGAIRAALG